jgi:hypothetical protein
VNTVSEIPETVTTKDVDPPADGDVAGSGKAPSSISDSPKVDVSPVAHRLATFPRFP